jgi:hypothetical protein
MTSEHVVRRRDGARFEDGPDRGRVLVFGRQTGGRYSLIEYVVAPRPPAETPDFGPHRHLQIEETFLVRRGRLRFLRDLYTCLTRRCYARSRWRWPS